MFLNKVHMSFSRALLLFLIVTLSTGTGSGSYAVAFMSDERPTPLRQKGYSETWDQHIYFPDGSFLTARFLFANFKKKKTRAIVIASLVTPDGKIFTVKNGRGRKGWSFDENGFDLHIADHELSGQDKKINLHLKNNTAEIQLSLSPTLQTWRPETLCCGKDESIYQMVSFLAPRLTAQGWYQLGPDAKVKKEDRVRHNLNDGAGFALHYFNTASLNKIAKSWLHFSSLTATADSPVSLVSLITPQNKKLTRFAILDKTKPQLQVNASVDMVDVDRLFDPKSALPYEIPITIDGDTASISGTIRFEQLLDKIVIKDQLNWIERLMASSLASMVQYYFLATYEFDVTDKEDVTRHLEGKALLEYGTVKS